MTLGTFLASYGYLALWLGTFLEGETILVLGGVAAHQGYLKLTGVILAAFAGSFMGDQLFFFLGRRHSDYILRKRPGWQHSIDRVNLLLARFENTTILIFIACSLMEACIFHFGQIILCQLVWLGEQF